MINKTTKEHRKRRHGRVRTHVSGTKERPRLSVFRSGRQTVAQLIDDTTGTTIAYVTSKDSVGNTPTERAHHTGKKTAEVAKKHKIKKVVFDRGGFLFAGRVRAVAEGAREGGLEF